MIRLTDTIRKVPGSLNRMETCASGKKAVTNVRVLHRYASYDLVQCTLETGRTHQIRVHLASIGHPLLGDTIYADESVGESDPKKNSPGMISRAALHCARTVFLHPVSRSQVILEAPLPEDMRVLLTDEPD